MSIALELDREVWSIIDAPRRKRGRPVGCRNKPKKRVIPADRDARMILMREQGSTLEEIGGAFGITRERARQLLARQGHVQIGRPVSVDAIAVLRAARAPDITNYGQVPAAAGVAAVDVYRALNALGVRPALMRLYRMRRKRAALQRICAFVALHGRVPFATEMGQGQAPKQDSSLPAGTELQQLFGSIRAAMSLAGFTPRKAGMRGKAPARQFCKRGHPWTPDNTYTFPSTGYKQCRTCMRARKAK